MPTIGEGPLQSTCAASFCTPKTPISSTIILLHVFFIEFSLVRLSRWNFSVKDLATRTYRGGGEDVAELLFDYGHRGNIRKTFKDAVLGTCPQGLLYQWRGAKPLRRRLN